MSNGLAKIVTEITGRLEKGIAPLVARVKKLEERDHKIAALEARLVRLEVEAAQRNSGTSE